LDLPYLKQTSSASQAEAQNPELGHKATHVVTIELMTGSLELADSFTHVFLLEMDEPTMLARLDVPSRDNEWGRIGDTREHVRRRLPGHQERLRAFGAIPIDARQPLDQVVDAILSHTLASSATS
jgi:hypothetical protein